MRIDGFLLARIAEDEAAAEHGRRHNDVGTYANDNYGCLLVDPTRVLLECEAKRRVVAEHDAAHILHDQGPPKPCSVDVGTTRTALVWPCRTMRILAAVYADHPDFDPAWAVDSNLP